MGFLTELRRRNVFRVAGMYVVGAWLVIQIAETLLPIFETPAWVLKALTTLLAVGVIPALVAAWVFEWTPEGIKRDRGTAVAPAVDAGTAAHRMDRVVIIGLVIMLAVMLGERFVSSPSEQTTGYDQAGPSGEQRVAQGQREASVAVLPFVNMSSDAENEYFSDGLTDTLLHMLAQVPELKVSARTSSFAFKGKHVDVREVAEKLGVATVLEGSVQRSGDKVRIVAQLIDANGGFHIWSQNFDRRLDDIFAVQDEIAREVAQTLKGSLLAESDTSRMESGLTRNPEAYELYLRALKNLQIDTEASAAESEHQLRRALELDDQFALAWTALSKATEKLGSLRGMPTIELREAVLAAARKGVMLAPQSAQARAELGYALGAWSSDYVEGEAELRRALALQPDYAYAVANLASNLFQQGKFSESAELARRAMRLDPLDDEVKLESTYKLSAVGDHQEAVAIAEGVLARNPDSLNGLSALANILWRNGQLAQAVPIYLRMHELAPKLNFVPERIASAFYWLGDAGEARRWLDRAYAFDPTRFAGEIARLCFYAGDTKCSIDLMSQTLPNLTTPRSIAYARLRLARYQQRWDEMYEACMHLATILREDKSLLSIGLGTTLTECAFAAERAGDAETRDSAIADALELNQAIVDSGSRMQYGFFINAAALALRGDAEASLQNLRIAIDRGFRDASEVRQWGHFDKLLDTPELQQILRELDASNAAELERLRTAVAEFEARRAKSADR